MNKIKSFFQDKYDKLCLGVGIIFLLAGILGLVTGGTDDVLHQLQENVELAKGRTERAKPPREDHPLVQKIRNGLSTTEKLEQSMQKTGKTEVFHKWSFYARGTGDNVDIPAVKVGKTKTFDTISVKRIVQVLLKEGQDFASVEIGKDGMSLIVKGLQSGSYSGKLIREDKGILTFSGEVAEAVDIGIPEDFQGEAQIGRIVLSWQKGPGNVEITGYEVIRRSPTEAPFTEDDKRVIHEGLLENVLFIDGDVEPRTEYIYAVRSLGRIPEEAPTATPLVMGLSAPAPAEAATEAAYRDVTSELSKKITVKSLTDTKLTYKSDAGETHQIKIMKWDRDRDMWIYVSLWPTVGDAIKGSDYLRDENGKKVTDKKVAFDTSYVLTKAYVKQKEIRTVKSRPKIDPVTKQPVRDKHGNIVYEDVVTIMLIPTKCIKVKDLLTGVEEELEKTRK